MLIVIISLIVVILVLLYLLVRFNSLWIYRFLDLALRNDRNSLPEKYELPRYFKLNKDGEVDTSVRWPGWDGWYFFMLPEDKNFPIKMIRASLMTGLYGLNGADNYEKLSLSGLSSFKAVEYLTLILTEERINGKGEKESHLSQHYLPKATNLTMNHKKLDVAITGAEVSGGGETEQYGKISGAWPNYKFEFINPEVEFELNYKGEKIVWWADAPNIFTYFAAFGKFDGKIICKRGKNEADNLKEEVYFIEGVGGFEHGFARKPFNFDGFWLPIRLLKKVFPSFNPIRYHYELFIGDDNFQGGFMSARGFGIDFRNQGGFYLNGIYEKINSVKIEYFDKPEPDLAETQSSGQPVKFYRKWKVKAMTDDGILEYIGTREWPLAPVTGNMTYYNFSYEGAYKGQSINGRGYGEYLHI